jgi:hypothetical protein
MDGRKDYTSNAGQMPGASRSDAQGTISNQSPSSPLTPPAGSGFGQSTSAPSLSGLRQQAEQTRSEVGEALDRGWSRLRSTDAFRMAWELSASPTCLPSGPASTRCSGFRRHSSPFEPSL